MTTAWLLHKGLHKLLQREIESRGDYSGSRVAARKQGDTRLLASQRCLYPHPHFQPTSAAWYHAKASWLSS